MNPLSLVPSWAWLAALVAVLALSGVQTVRLSSVKAEFAGEQLERANERALHEEVARETLQKHLAAQAEHARQTQELTDDFEKQISALRNARAADAATAGRLRDQIAEFAAGGRRAGDTDAVACQRAGDRLRTVGGLLGEGADLVIEGRQIIQRRDAEVNRLLRQIETDRAACAN